MSKEGQPNALNGGDDVMQPQAMDGDGQRVDPRAGAVPIMRELSKGRLQIVGTGFYITRYGLFMSAHHVVATLVDEGKARLGVGYVCHVNEDRTVHLRRIRRAGFCHQADLAVGQADNYVDQYPQNPLVNMRAPLTARVPEPGSRVVTCAYPENKVLDFTEEGDTPVIASDYFEGKFLTSVVNSEHPCMPYPYFETTIGLKGGASGGPVFSKGQVVGVNCRGWEFAGAEHEGHKGPRARHALRPGHGEDEPAQAGLPGRGRAGGRQCLAQAPRPRRRARVFTQPHGTTWRDPKRINKWLRLALSKVKDSKIPAWKRDGDKTYLRFTFHGLRYTHRTIAAQLGIAMHIIDAQVGHKGPFMSSHYTTVPESELLKAAQTVNSGHQRASRARARAKTHGGLTD